MKSIIIKILTSRITIIAIAALIGYNLVATILDQKKEIDRVSDNFFNERLEHSVKLNVKDWEFKKMMKADQEVIQILKDSLDIKRKQIKNLKKVGSYVKIKVKTEVRDTTIYKHDTVYYGQTFDYQDTWNTVDGFIAQDSINLDITSTDSLYIVYRKYKKGNWFLPRWFSKTYFKTEMTNKNPNHTYILHEEIEVLD